MSCVLAGVDSLSAGGKGGCDSVGRVDGGGTSAFGSGSADRRVFASKETNLNVEMGQSEPRHDMSRAELSLHDLLARPDTLQAEFVQGGGAGRHGDVPIPTRLMQPQRESTHRSGGL